ncbi:YIP1 family protein [Natronorubrum sp. FCH18a]|uniref:YIP1 family protein n=1 Tax=Natronorubrum sp. FCH18a TaxID=3447018 RepID=UPI003F516A96
MVLAVRSLKRLLLSPTSFFDERSPAETLPVAAGIVALFALCFVGSILLVGTMLAGSVDGTVTMDNPDRPPEQVCNTHEEMLDGCDAPETIERDMGAMAQEAVHDFLWIALIGPFVLWLVGGVVLFGAGRLANGNPSFAGSLALAGWAALPEFFRLAVGLGGLWVALEGVTITDPDRAVTVLESALAPVQPVLLLASLVTLGWQWYLLTGGMTREAEISRAAAAVSVGVPLGLFGLFGLL